MRFGCLELNGIARENEAASTATVKWPSRGDNTVNLGPAVLFISPPDRA
jgi:hypothetical protein